MSAEVGDSFPAREMSSISGLGERKWLAGGVAAGLYWSKYVLTIVPGSEGDCVLPAGEKVRGSQSVFIR
jgi:hypothetical protein